MDEARRKKRMLQDIDMISLQEAWPDRRVLHLKTQPWIEDRKFGYVHAAMPTTVFVKSMTISTRTHETLHYSSVEEMVKTWSVD